MLNATPTHGYLAVTTDTGVIVGKFVLEVDGYYYFLPGSNNTGLFSEEILAEIVSLLRDLNAPIEEALDEYFASLPTELGSVESTEDDTPF